MNVAAVMTAGPVTVRPDTKLAAAVALFVEKRVSGLPVLDESGRLVGILTEGDLLRRAETGTERQPHWFEALFSQPRLAAEYIRAHTRTVADVMTREVLTVTGETRLADAVRLMEEHHIRRLPVLDRPGGALVGILSRADFMRALACALAGPPAPLASDDAIRARILAEIEGEAWAPSLRNIAITVADGTVTLSGIILHGAQRKALEVLVAGVPGVKDVRDELALVEPTTGGLIPG